MEIETLVLKYGQRYIWGLTHCKIERGTYGSDRLVWTDVHMGIDTLYIIEKGTYGG